MDRSNISYIAPQMMEDLHMTKQQFGLLASFFSLGYALMQVPSGMLAEKFGPRKMITIALVWWSAFTIFTGMIKHHGLLYLVRFLFGIGEAPMYPSNACLMQTGSLKMRKVEHLVCYSPVLILDLY